MINYGKQYLDKKDISAVVSVLKSDWLTQGPKVKEFETSLKIFWCKILFCSIKWNCCITFSGKSNGLEKR